MLNRVILIGRLTADPELRYTNSGTAVAKFTLAVDRQRRGSNNEQTTDFIDILAWGKQGENCAQYLNKGRLAAVDGRLQIRTFTGNEGNRVRMTEVIAESVQFLERSNAQNQNQNQGQNQNRQGQRPTNAQSNPSGNLFGNEPDDRNDPFADDLPF